MSDETKQVDIEWCLKNALIFSGVKDRLLAELARLRAEAAKVQRLDNVEKSLEIACSRLLIYQCESEAWKKLRSVYLDDKYCADARMENLWSEMRTQIARLDQMNEKETPNENPS